MSDDIPNFEKKKHYATRNEQNGETQHNIIIEQWTKTHHGENNKGILEILFDKQQTH